MNMLRLSFRLSELWLKFIDLFYKKIMQYHEWNPQIYVFHFNCLR